MVEKSNSRGGSISIIISSGGGGSKVARQKCRAPVQRSEMTSYS